MSIDTPKVAPSIQKTWIAMQYSFVTMFPPLVDALIATIIVFGGLSLASTIRGNEPTAEPVVDYSIIVTGTELLSGVYADGHTLFLTKTLRPLGLHCVGSLCVDDRPDDIRRALKFMLPHSDLVIITGGLGPTDSDITREVLSDFTSISCREDSTLLREMEQRFHTSRDQLRSNLRRQTRVPVQGTFLPNRVGTAVGLVFEYEDKVIAALPGPPRELQPMVRDHLVGYLADRFGVRTLGSTLTVRFVGLGQSEIDQTMKEHVNLPKDVMQTSQFESSRVDFTFSLPGDSAEDRQRLEELRRELRQCLGDHIYADDPSITLEAAAVTKLDAEEQTVVLVELASAGTVAAGFAGTPRGSHVLAGAYVAPDMTRMQRVLRIPTDRQSTSTTTARLERIATVAQKRVASDWALVVGPPERREERTRVRVLVRTPAGKQIHHTRPWRGSSRSSLARLETEVFDLLRRVASDT
ncbi:MAG: molybdopterin-binding protein [Pirellulaceae bacterium]